jgi:hypothetical protein
VNLDKGDILVDYQLFREIFDQIFPWFSEDAIRIFYCDLKEDYWNDIGVRPGERLSTYMLRTLEYMAT